MPKIHLLFFDAGGGHRSAATALQAAAHERNAFTKHLPLCNASVFVIGYI